MSLWAKQYRKQDGEFGTFIVEETGLCYASDAAHVEGDVVTRYKLIAIPNSKGVIMKVLDGSSARIETVSPLTDGRSYKCVKIHGKVEPYAPAHSGGLSGGLAILAYVMRYQQVGGLV